MAAIDEVDPLGQTLQVQAGAVTQAVHDHCADSGLIWPIDFAAKGQSQIGGNIATNAGGLRVIRYGSTRNWVLGLEAVTMTGDILQLDGALEKNNSGPHLRQLMIGSEGILAVVTAATLKLAPLPESTQVMLVALKNLADVLNLLHQIRQQKQTILRAFEYIGRECIDLLIQHKEQGFPLESDAQAYALLEFEGDMAAIEGLLSSEYLVDGVVAQSTKQAAQLWAWREDISETLSRRGPVHKNDLAVPVAKFQVFVAELRSLFAGLYRDLDVFLYGHVGDGNIHLNIVKPVALSTEAFIQRCKNADGEIYRLVAKHQGSVSAEHGIGLLKKHALGYCRSPAEVDLLQRIKTCFDPNWLLNPGKVVDRPVK
jgi:FAD/FMN-containing dehydrogenase